MSKEDCIEVSGTVVEKFPGGHFFPRADLEAFLAAVAVDLHAG